jgi:hypothetical protein
LGEAWKMNRVRQVDCAPLRIWLEEADRSGFARALYTNCFFDPEWLRAHAPIGRDDALCI